jgi:hypothetical protein
MIRIKTVLYCCSIILSIGCAHPTTKIKSNYYQYAAEYGKLISELNGIDNGLCSPISFRYRKDLHQIEIHIADSSSNLIRTSYYDMNAGRFEEGSSFDCAKSIEAVQGFFQKTNCSVIEWRRPCLFIGYFGNIKTNNAEFESGISVCQKGFSQELGHAIEQINDTVVVFEKRVL